MRIYLSRDNVVACSLELSRLTHAITHALVSRALITAKWYVVRISLSRDNVVACSLKLYHTKISPVTSKAITTTVTVDYSLYTYFYTGV